MRGRVLSGSRLLPTRIQINVAGRHGQVCTGSADRNKKIQLRVVIDEIVYIVGTLGQVGPFFRLEDSR